MDITEVISMMRRKQCKNYPHGEMVRCNVCRTFITIKGHVLVIKEVDE